MADQSHFAHLTVGVDGNRYLSTSRALSPTGTRLDVFNYLLGELRIETGHAIDNYVVMFFAVDPMKL